MTMDISTIIGYSLFLISEILPLMNIPTNGFLHTFVLGFSNAFKNPKKDIEMAQSLVTDPSLANIINAINSNPQIKISVDNILNDPQLASLVNLSSKSLLLPLFNQLHTFNPDIINTLITLNNNSNKNSILNIINTLIHHPEFIENINETYKINK